MKNMNILSLPSKFLLYLKQVKVEAKKTNWPTRKETIRYSLVVVAISIVVAIFLGGLDFLFSTLLKKLVALLA
jgi:preprotein translocase subunit SecE